MRLTFKSTTFFKPCNNASYSTMLFVHSNFSLHAIMNLLPFQSQMMQLAPTKVPNPLSINNALIGQKSRTQTPPFLLTFEFYNNKLHNCLVDSRASTNVMPYDVCHKMNAKPHRCSNQIVQLNKSIV